MLIRIASQYQSPRSRLEFAGSNHCLRHLDRITDENLFAMKRNRATEIAYILIDFIGSGVVGRTRDVGSRSAGLDQRDFDTELRDFRNTCTSTDCNEFRSRLNELFGKIYPKSQARKFVRRAVTEGSVQKRAISHKIVE
jgi:hypothetical protein